MKSTSSFCLLISTFYLGLILLTGCGPDRTTVKPADSKGDSTANKSQAVSNANDETRVAENTKLIDSLNGKYKSAWPQIMGKNRNGVAAGEKLLSEWPASGPESVWSYEVGSGYAGPVVFEDRVLIFHGKRGAHIADLLDANDGSRIWRTEIPSEARAGGPDPDIGPKCVPVIEGKFAYLHCLDGKVVCLNLGDGSQVWMRELAKELSSDAGYFGFGSTPIVMDGKLLVNAGGRSPNSAVVALDLKTGKTVWSAYTDKASYSSPVAASHLGKPVAVFVTRMNLIGIDPTNGEMKFALPFGKRGPTVNGAMPVVVGDQVFINSSYGVGAKLVDLSTEAPTIKWENDESFSSQYSTPVLHDGVLYGTAGREDYNNGSFRAVEAKTGNVKWTQDKFPVGHTFLIGKQMLVLDFEGVLHVVDVNPDKFNETHRAELFGSPARGIPALLNGKLYARSNASGGVGKLICVQVGE